MLPSGSSTRVVQAPQPALAPLDRKPAQRGEADRPLAVEARVLVVDEHERRLDEQLAVAEDRRREGQETTPLVAAENVQAEDTPALGVEEQVDRSAELDPAHAHREAEQPLARHARIRRAELSRKHLHPRRYLPRRRPANVQ
jgi:hypothetical protein